MPADIASSDAAVVSEARSGSNLEPDAKEILDRYVGSDEALFNDSVVRGLPGQVALKREQAHQRMMVLLRAQGFTAVEIGAELGYTPTTVNYVLRQPWARERLVKLIHAKGEEGIDALLKAELVPSLMGLVEVRDDPSSKKGEKLAACTALIDRYLGKPVQRTEISKAPTSADVDALQREAERLSAEVNRLKAN